jgi:hypothetical protein
MSLSHTLFTLPAHEQLEVIKALARKCTGRKEFDRTIRPLLHAKYAAGGSQYESKMLRREWRQIFRAVKNEAV